MHEPEVRIGELVHTFPQGEYVISMTTFLGDLFVCTNEAAYVAWQCKGPLIPINEALYA